MATTIKEILDSLSPQDRGTLQYAFEQNKTHYIRLPGNKFVGVNIRDTRFLTPTMNSGLWSAGEVKVTEQK